MKDRLNKIQTELKAPKNQFNKFGGYKYRSCEDILEALKPMLKELKCNLVIEDDIIRKGDRFYIKATAKLVDTETEAEISTTAYAREPEDKKGMDAAQITGASSSYARKYALNGLFLIDDTKDADATNTGENKASQKIDHIKELKKKLYKDYGAQSEEDANKVLADKSINKDITKITQEEAKGVIKFL